MLGNGSKRHKDVLSTPGLAPSTPLGDNDVSIVQSLDEGEEPILVCTLSINGMLTAKYVRGRDA